ncbi:transcriptional regulator, TetR family [Humidesulfovibrio mexicanus]|uniref:Transcriptional regulator, TetR family n=2 Tax=Humidesulfovibrio mexicanus TaxID=147047 RepID=A0A238Z2S2_9BACT|nr:transcriptional regulator, TetR family [Humidesulfovibrio mexicanus]
MRNRMALLASAKSLIAAKGVKAASISEIAARAGVAKGLLFYYFKDKDSLVQAIDQEVQSGYMRDLPPAGGSGTARERLHALIRHHFDFLASSPEDAQFLYQSGGTAAGAAGFYDHLHERILGILAQGERAGEFVSGDKEALAYMLLGSLHGVGRLMLHEFKRDYDAVHHLAAMCDKILMRQGDGPEGPGF